jgi:polyisoprenoid-binding protein YceI
MKTKLGYLFLWISATALGAPASFDFKDAKNVNHVAFKLDAPLEAISGIANGISGTVLFDPDAPEATKGKIVVASRSLTLGNPMQQQHMQGAQWLDIQKFPEITFETKEVKNAKASGNVTTADVVGTFTLKGVSKEMTIPVKLTYLKDKLQERSPNLKGDLLVVRSDFKIKRSDFNIAAH